MKENNEWERIIDSLILSEAQGTGFHIVKLTNKSKKALAQAIESHHKKLVIELLDKIDKCWSFDNAQQHTHSWHTKQDLLTKLRKEYRS